MIENAGRHRVNGKRGKLTDGTGKFQTLRKKIQDNQGTVSGADQPDYNTASAGTLWKAYDLQHIF